VCIFDDEKYLNTNQSTEYNEIENVQGINLDAPQMKDNILSGECVAVQVKRTSCCLVSNNGFDLPTASEEIVTCHSCKSDMRVETLKAKLVAQVTVKTNELACLTLFSYDIFTKQLEMLGPSTGIEGLFMSFVPFVLENLDKNCISLYTEALKKCTTSRSNIIHGII
jgi:hypothetical protein